MDYAGRVVVRQGPDTCCFGDVVDQAVNKVLILLCEHWRTAVIPHDVPLSIPFRIGGCQRSDGRLTVTVIPHVVEGLGVDLGLLGGEPSRDSFLIECFSDIWPVGLFKRLNSRLTASLLCIDLRVEVSHAFIHGIVYQVIEVNETYLTFHQRDTGSVSAQDGAVYWKI